MSRESTSNRLVECPEPGIMFTRANAMWAYRALKDVRESGRSIPEQDGLCDELAGLLFPASRTAAPACPAPPQPGQDYGLIPGEDGTDNPDDPDPDPPASAVPLLPALGELMNPAHPEGAMFYDKDQVAYVVRQVSPEDRQGTWGAVRVLTSFGRLRGWTLDSEHEIRHDQTFRYLGRWRVAGIRNYKTGWQAGEIPDQPLHQWVFK